MFWFVIRIIDFPSFTFLDWTLCVNVLFLEYVMKTKTLKDAKGRWGSLGAKAVS
jgi:hypothetical protein